MMDKIRKDKVKQVFITKTAIKTNSSETMVEKILEHIHKKTLLAFHHEPEIEISGFGKFVVTNTKLKRKVDKYTNIKKGYERILASNPTEDIRIKTEKKLESINRDLGIVLKRNKDESNIRIPEVSSEGDTQLG